MKTQIGTMITGDFGENTMTFEIEGDMILKAGKYAIMTIEEYEKLINQTDKIKCSECGEYFEKKEIIIKGDIDTCNECLCPE